MKLNYISIWVDCSHCLHLIRQKIFTEYERDNNGVVLMTTFKFARILPWGNNNDKKEIEYWLLIMPTNSSGLLSSLTG